MYISSITFITSTLISTAFALPKPSSVTQKRSIRIPAQHWHEDSTTTLKSRDIGSVQASNPGGGGWTIPVLIGGQQVILNLDTGSSDLWTASTLMPPDNQSTVTTGNPLYNPNSSTTFQYLDGYSFDIGYADGSGSSGPVGTDTVDIGGATVPSMPFGVCNDLRYGSGETGRNTDGPVGLGFGSENSIQLNGQPAPQCTFVECLEPYIPEPIFTTYFTLNDSGIFDLGWVDTSLYTGDLTEIPIFNTSSGNEGQWVAENVTFGFNGSAFDAPQIVMDFDIGTASLQVPDAVAGAYFAQVNGATNNSNTWSYPCEETLPDLDVIFGNVNSGPECATIPGSAIQYGNATSGTCTTWIGVGTGRGNAGLPFYISHFMIWNQSVPTLAFAPQA